HHRTRFQRLNPLLPGALLEFVVFCTGIKNDAFRLKANKVVIPFLLVYRGQIQRNSIYIRNLGFCPDIYDGLSSNLATANAKRDDRVTVLLQHLTGNPCISASVGRCSYYYSLLTTHYNFFKLNTRAKASAQRSPSIAADMIPPAYPAPSPHGNNPGA